VVGVTDTPTPTWRTVLPAVAATVLVVAITGPVPVAGLVAIVGAAAVIAGVRLCSRPVLGIGVVIQFLGVVVAALGALRIELVLAATLAVVLTWDFAEQAVGVAEQLRVTGSGTRPLGVHAAGTLLVGTLLFVGIYVLYQAVGGGQPLLALVLLLAGGGIVLAGTRV